MITPPFMRRIFIDQLVIAARIGILEHELRATQPIYVNAEFDTVVTQPSNDKDIDSVLDYRQLRQTIIDCCTHQHVNLLETLIEHTAQTILQQFPSIRRVHLRISKPQAFSDCAGVGIELELTR
ncbi:MAG TPA: dihydroneopterin aldolase [Paenalcaligenes hominis]|uniref:dihydroneopterin aldolase n=2 Tax=Paenalcaligenes hominis TaxID=643674 RepID=A0A9D2VFL0_9BURK|nr:dihydroneopterin aldolase [Paenalcaligenes hominis]NJB64962.1 dihydroneopterin aldolase [Paenalcaligenes hominis]GGE57764.1 7,8-dihydroneopterin aldolase [Paenalcaligenes hominis]HJH23640.1 dihydroneopterin aldolase [Paenalcaligenes hominis]